MRRLYLPRRGRLFLVPLFLWISGDRFNFVAIQSTFAQPPKTDLAPIDPILKVVDLDVGESVEVTLSNGKKSTVKLLSLDERVDSIREAVREAKVAVEVDGQRVDLVSATYHLPVQTGQVQIDCSITRGYNTNGTASSWGLDKAARIRLWPAGSPLTQPGTFIYPVKQRWFATYTQMANEPTYVDGGEPPTKRNIYYHSGLDIGGSEGQVEVIAATDALVVSSGEQILDEYRRDTPARTRYDVVYLLDGRGWFYRYSHFQKIDPHVVPGRYVKMGERLGLLGKEGGSGGWTHLHFEPVARQPSGKWGTQEGYAFLWEAYLREHKPAVIAVARPHHLIRAGESVELDGSRSWAHSGKIAEYRWTLSNGQTSREPRFRQTYDKPGVFSEVLEVRDASGKAAYDFAVVQVHDPARPAERPPTIHAAYYPTLGIKPGEPVTFKVRSFGAKDCEETWNFRDGTAAVKVHSDGNANQHAPDGYAATTHSFSKPGSYLVRVERTSPPSYPAIAHLHVTVEEPNSP